jgi:hypothetical protein
MIAVIYPLAATNDVRNLTHRCNLIPQEPE